MANLSAERRRRLYSRGLPALGGLAAAALVAGLIVGGGVESASVRAAREFGRAWQRGDYAGMYALLSPEARASYDPAAFREAYRAAADTATEVGVTAGSPRGAGGGNASLPVRVRTRVFGTIPGQIELPTSDGRVDWRPDLVFPGLTEGARLTRDTQAPPRGRILARNGKVLAAGPATARTSPLGPASIAGEVGTPATAADRRAAFARGFAPTAPVGRTGLERAFDARLSGRPGGELILSGHVIARARPRPGEDVRTTIDTRIQQAAQVALAGRLGGIAALDPRTGEVRALAGIAFSAPQPPGSTFKIITTTAALQARAVRLTERFPVQSAAIIDGVRLENANGEFCGGDFVESFAQSCNSVFAPLGVRVGARRLVAAAERYGFNAPPELPGEAPSTLPPASQIQTPLEVGSTAIGQFKVLATPLRMAAVAQTVAARGVRFGLTLVPRNGRPARRIRVTSRRVARRLRALMEKVVEGGTGTAAAIPGVRVAGKTGTAELENTRGPGTAQSEHDTSNTDAWFTAFAPANRPRIAVAVLLVKAGAGGATAAPAARGVIATALGL